MKLFLVGRADPGDNEARVYAAETGEEACRKAFPPLLVPYVDAWFVEVTPVRIEA